MKTAIVDTEEPYRALYERCAAVFCLGTNELPEQVFLPGFTNFCFVEFDVMFSREFWSVLANCAIVNHDQELSVVIHDPHPRDYYCRHFGYYGAIRLGSGAASLDYKKAFLFEPEGSPADAFQFTARIVSWCGSSQQWGFWAERDLGVGVAATRNPKMSWPIGDVRWWDIDTALSSLVAPNFANNAIPEEFEKKFRRSFSGRGTEGLSL